MADDSRQQNQNQARQQTVGSVKRPGTYETVKVVSGVVGKGGGIVQSTPASSGSSISQSISSSSQSSSSSSSSQPTSQPNKLSEVLKPPTTALSPSLPTTTYSQGYSSVPSSSYSGGSSSSSSSSQPQSVQSSNKLSEVLKPPTTALTPSLPTSTYSQGYSNVPVATESNTY